MKNLKFCMIAWSCFMGGSVFAQVEVDHPIQLTGSGANAKISGIQNVTNTGDATSVGSIQNGNFVFADDSGSNNNFAITISPPVAAYKKGMTFNFISGQTVTGPATLNVNNLGPVPFKKNVSLDFTGCEIQAGQFVGAAYDGANFQMTSVFSSYIAASVAISANPSGAICADANVSFVATPGAGLNSPSYQWQVNGMNAGTNSSTFSSSTFNNNDVVTCILSSGAPCVSGLPVTSNAITMAVNPIPSLSSSLNPAAICSGTTFSYNPASAASGATFNWSRAAVSGISNAAAAGTGNPNEILNDTTGTSVNVTYIYAIAANGCTDTQSVVVAVNPAAAVNGLIGHWPLAGNANDISGYGNNGTVYSVSFGAGYGESGEGAYFNGSGSYIDVANASVFDVSSYTIDVWINFNPPSGEFRIFSNGGYGNANGAIDFGLGSSSGGYTNRIFVLNQNNGGQDVYRLNMSLSGNTWYNIAITYDATTLAPAYYVNGSPVAGTFDSGNNLRVPNSSPSYDYRIGTNGNGGGGYYNGDMDEVRFYNRALSPTEIQNVYTASCE